MKRLTIADLIDAYRADPDSPYLKLRYRTRENSDSLLRRIRVDMGFLTICEDEIDARFMLRMHEQWTVRGVAMAHSLIAQLRSLATFGATLLKNKPCRELKILLHDMKFKNSTPRTLFLTAEQADLIRHHARTAQLASMSLAQAFQFEFAFRQKDVIGEWVPEREPGESDTTWRGQKWLRGVRWEEIDADLILTHVTSKRGKLATHDLTLAQMVVDELTRAYPGFARADGTLDRSALPVSGPIIVHEETGRPWLTPKFRATWRMIARTAGIPDDVQNRDSRAGAITEATDGGASLEQAKELAGHSDIQTTQIYSRAKASKAREAQTARVAQRKKPA
jgi:hypothetical protein